MKKANLLNRVLKIILVLLPISLKVYSQTNVLDSLKNEIALNKKTLNFRLKELRNQEGSLYRSNMPIGLAKDSLKSISKLIKQEKIDFDLRVIDLNNEYKKHYYLSKKYEKDIGIYKYKILGNFLKISGLVVTGSSAFVLLINGMSEDLDPQNAANYQKSKNETTLISASVMAVGGATSLSGLLLTNKYKRLQKENPYTIGFTPIFAPKNTYGMRFCLKF